VGSAGDDRVRLGPYLTSDAAGLGRSLRARQLQAALDTGDSTATVLEPWCLILGAQPVRIVEDAFLISKVGALEAVTAFAR
jgi:hypothetical protein